MTNESETPLSRMREMGIRASSPVDLLAVGFSRRMEDVAGSEKEARFLLERFEKIFRIGELSAVEIGAITGFDEFEVFRAQALMELGRRSAVAAVGDLKEMDCAEAVYQLLKGLTTEKREHFVVVMLDAKNKVMKHATVHIGTLTMSVVGPREVFREAIREGASSIIVAHNHPSGDTTPSPEDIEVTNKLQEVGRMLDIPVLDHIIIGRGSYASLRQKGCIK